MNIQEFSTKEITEELSIRKGVETIKVEPYQEVKLIIDQKEYNYQGPAVILVNID